MELMTAGCTVDRARVLVRLGNGGKDAVAGVAETGKDVALFVQPLVDMCDVNIDAGVLRLHRSDAFGAGDEANEGHV